MSESSPVPFAELGLAEPIMQAVADVGYETPSPIQAAAIPALLAGHDLLGQAQTGTGKTAAFALPLLSRLDPRVQATQVLVLAPTRELAIQVAEAMQTYARHLKGFHVLPVYGGQAYGTQLRGLKRGAHVVVGTPGRILDHLERGSLKLDDLRSLVLDEADEMLRMGFIDDVERILEQTPGERQLALFSATMPKEIKRVTERYLRNPTQVKIEARTATVDTINQRYWLARGLGKLDGLTRILEAEDFDGMIIFVRTRLATNELAEKLEARGFAAAALNGDLNQEQRERTVDRLKKGSLDILVATDVAARGLDVERISHVVNYDIPNDPETYVHRIGRTGRAGRKGETILFVTPREQRMLRTIEKVTRQPVTPMELPSRADVAERRIGRFKARIDGVLQDQPLDFFRALLRSYGHEIDRPMEDIAAAMAYLLQTDQPLELGDLPEAEAPRRRERDERRKPAQAEGERPPRKVKRREPGEEEVPMETFRIEVGREHGVQPKNIVGAIANEAELESRYIGHIQLEDSYSLVDLPVGMPNEVLQHLRRVWICNRQLKMSRLGGGAPESADSDEFSDAPPRKSKAKPMPRTKPAGKNKGKKKVRKFKRDA